MGEQGTNSLEAMLETKDTSEMRGKYLTFWTDKQLFGIPISDIVQIVGIQDITDVPELPDYAKGIINLRGEIIPVIDIRIRFGKKEIPYDERTCIIIVSMTKLLVGIVVDSINEVAFIKDKNISPPPKFSSKSENAYITGVGKHDEKVILLLDTKKILSGEQMELLGTVKS